jgi:hypothetical protein
MVLATRSAAPPGAKPTSIRVTELARETWKGAAMEQAAAPIATSQRLRGTFMIVSSFRLSAHFC